MSLNHEIGSGLKPNHLGQSQHGQILMVVLLFHHIVAIYGVYQGSGQAYNLIKPVLWWFGSRLRPIFETAPAASKMTLVARVVKSDSKILVC